jgi:hypothetical protein
MAKKKKKGKVAIVIAVKPMGGVAPKKPEDTANAVGVKKARNCKNCDCPKSECVCKAGYC